MCKLFGEEYGEDIKEVAKHVLMTQQTKIEIIYMRYTYDLSKL